jgi:hypothetical protein
MFPLVTGEKESDVDQGWRQPNLEFLDPIPRSGRVLEVCLAQQNLYETFEIRLGSE